MAGLYGEELGGYSEAFVDALSEGARSPRKIKGLDEYLRNKSFGDGPYKVNPFESSREDYAMNAYENEQARLKYKNMLEKRYYEFDRQKHFGTASRKAYEQSLDDLYQILKEEKGVKPKHLGEYLSRGASVSRKKYVGSEPGEINFDDYIKSKMSKGVDFAEALEDYETDYLPDMYEKYGIRADESVIDDLIELEYENAKQRTGKLKNVLDKAKGITGKTFNTALKILEESGGPLTAAQLSDILINAPTGGTTIGDTKAQEAAARQFDIDNMYINEAKKYLISTYGPGNYPADKVQAVAGFMKQRAESMPRTQPEFRAR